MILTVAIVFVCLFVFSFFFGFVIVFQGINFSYIIILYWLSSGCNYKYARGARRAAAARQQLRTFFGQRDCSMHPKDRRHCRSCPSLITHRFLAQSHVFLCSDTAVPLCTQFHLCHFEFIVSSRILICDFLKFLSFKEWNNLKWILYSIGSNQNIAFSVLLEINISCMRVIAIYYIQYI